MKTIQIDSFRFNIPDTFDELPVKIKAKLLQLLSQETKRELLKPKLLALLLRFCATNTSFIDKIKIFWFRNTLKDDTLYLLLFHFDGILTPLLSEFRTQTPPYDWVKPIDKLTFSEFRQAIGCLYRYNYTNKVDDLLLFCQILNKRERLPMLMEPTLLLIYFNTMMDLFAQAFPNLFKKSDEKPEGNPWATALKQVSQSPKNMEENDTAVCLTVFQWMEDTIKENIKKQEEHDNRSTN